MKSIVRHLCVTMLVAGQLFPVAAQQPTATPDGKGQPVPDAAGSIRYAGGATQGVPDPSPELDEWRKRFESEYALETRTYAVRNLQPETARLFVDRLVGNYYLMQDYTDRFGKYHAIGIAAEIDRLPDHGERVVAVVSETVVADERANVLVVDAIPATHKQIEELLQRIDGSLTRITNKDAVSHYRLEILLLHTDKTESRKDGLSFFTGNRDAFRMGALPYIAPPKMEAIVFPHLKSDSNDVVRLGSPVDGVVDEIFAKSGDAVPAGAPLLKLSPRAPERGPGRSPRAAAARDAARAVREASREALATASADAAASANAAAAANAAEAPEAPEPPKPPQEPSMPPPESQKVTEILKRQQEISRRQEGLTRQAEAIQKSAEDMAFSDLNISLNDLDSDARIIRMPQGGHINEILVKVGDTIYSQSQLMTMTPDEPESMKEMDLGQIEPKWQLDPVEGPHRAALASPIEGRLLKVLARSGDKVKDGQSLIVILPNGGKAPLAVPMEGTGRVKKLVAMQGKSVSEGEKIMEIELDPDAAKKLVGDGPNPNPRVEVKPAPAPKPKESVDINLGGFKLKVDGDKVYMRAGEEEGNSPDSEDDSLLDELAEKYNLSDEDRQMLEGGKLEIAGRAIVNIESDGSDLGSAEVDLGSISNSSARAICRIDYQDYRDPFLVLSVRLSPWMNNSVFLEPGKASLLGVTNLKEAVVLIVRRMDDKE